MCTHQPQCPTADAQGCTHARVISDQERQGWSLLCNGVIVFDDGVAMLPSGTTRLVS